MPLVPHIPDYTIALILTTGVIIKHRNANMHALKKLNDFENGWYTYKLDEESCSKL